MKPIARILAILFALFLSCPALASERANASTDALDAALAQLDTGISMLEDRQPEAKLTIRQAAADLEALIDEQGLQTAGLYHALGNAYMLTEDYGQAVLAYRRGEQINPTDPRLRDSLRNAREHVSIKVNPSTTHRIAQLLMIWRGFVPRDALWSMFIVFFVVPWLMLTARVALGAPRWFRAASFWLLAGSLIPLCALGAEWALHQGQDQVVLIQKDVTARSGPDDSIYDPVYDEPLDAGTEAVAHETRDGWVRLSLSDASVCWVRLESVARVHPVPSHE